jgi:hypothetical protein
MTAPIDREGGVRVSQAAREAAWQFVANRSGCKGGRQEALRGVHDETPLVQAFARFEAQAQVELVEALRESQHALEAARAYIIKLSGAKNPHREECIERNAILLARIEGGDQ